jgi:hypothetical protein
MASWDLIGPVQALPISGSYYPRADKNVIYSIVYEEYVYVLWQALWMSVPFTINRVYCSRFNGTEWKDIGCDSTLGLGIFPAITARLSDMSFVVDKVTGDFYIYASIPHEFDGSIVGAVYKFNGYEWAQFGPYIISPSFHRIIVDNSQVYINSYSGAQTFLALHYRLPVNSSVNSMAVIGSYLFAATASGVFRSTDN